MKRPLAFLLSLTLLLTTVPIAAFAATITNTTTSVPTATAMTPKKIVVYLKPDFTVQWNGVTQMFRNEQGAAVYPLVYNGSTYLPVRSISVLMKEPIEYSYRAQTIYIGKTLSNPSKISVTIPTGAAMAVPSGTALSLPQASSQIAWSKPDLLIMYDFAIQTFQDVNGAIVYPIIYNGTTYLPIRAIAALMKEPVDFDNVTKTVMIGDGEEAPAAATPPAVTTVTKTALQTMTALYDEEVLLYDESTAKINNIKSAVTAEEKAILATSISEDYLEAQEMTAALKAMDQTKFSTAEKSLYERMYPFFEATEYYLLVLENIAHLNAQGADYSMLAETFLYFAMDSRTKMQEARP